MTISKELAKFPNKADANNLDSVHLNLAIHIANQNKLRSDYFKDLVLGDPIWIYYSTSIYPKKWIGQQQLTPFPTAKINHIRSAADA